MLLRALQQGLCHPEHLRPPALLAFQNLGHIQQNMGNLQLCQQLLHLAAGHPVDAADDHQHLAGAGDLLPGQDTLGGGGGEDARVHRDEFQLGRDEGVHNGFHVLHGDGIAHQDARASFHRLVHSGCQALHAFGDVIQVDGFQRIAGLGLIELLGAGGGDRVFWVFRHLGLLEGDPVYQQVSPHQHPAGAGEAGDADCNIVRPQHIQEGVGLPPQVAPEGAVDALCVELYFLPPKGDQGGFYPLVGPLGVNGAAFGGHHQAVAVRQGAVGAVGGVQNGVGVKAVFLQQHPCGVGAGKVVRNDQDLCHLLHLLFLLPFFLQKKKGSEKRMTEQPVNMRFYKSGMAQ